MSELQCIIAPLGTLKPYRYVVVCSRYQGQWLLSRHRKRATWETQGGHIEPGESPLEAARRELWEESGAEEAELVPVCDYRGYRGADFSNGVVFAADIRRLGALPESEMAEVRAFAELPEQLTYPLVTPRLMAEALRRLSPEKKIFHREESQNE